MDNDEHQRNIVTVFFVIYSQMPLRNFLLYSKSLFAISDDKFYSDKLKNQDVSGWHFTFNSLDFRRSENEDLLGNITKVRHQIQHFEINLLQISTNQKTSFGSKMIEILHLAILNCL